MEKSHSRLVHWTFDAVQGAMWNSQTIDERRTTLHQPSNDSDLKKKTSNTARLADSDSTYQILQNVTEAKFFHRVAPINSSGPSQLVPGEPHMQMDKHR